MNKDLIISSYKKASANKREFADFFFEKLLKNFRETSSLLEKSDLSDLKLDFIRNFDFAIDHIDDHETLNIYLSQLGRRYENCGIKGFHYAFFGKTLIDTLSHFLQQDWNNEHLREWVTTYESFVDIMNSEWDQN